MNLLQKLISELKEKMCENDEFAFWEFLEKSSSLVESIRAENNGKIENNATITGKLFAGKNTVIKSGTVIEGPVFIGENCKIGPNAYLRNGAIIEGDSHIGMCEIKNSIILNGADIPHFSYIGDSIIGENVNFGAGSKVANLRFDNKNVKAGINGKTIDTGRRKLGVLVNSGTKIGCNAVLNCGVMIGKNCQVYPNTFLNRNLKSGEIFK